MVCTIGKTPYATIQAAVDAAKAKAVIMMTANTTENVTIPEGKDITFDIHGFVISGGTDKIDGHDTPNKDKPAFLNNGTLTIIDSDKSGKGMIKRDDVNVNDAYYVIDNQGVCTIESGKIFNDSGIFNGDKGGASLIRNGGEPGAPGKKYAPDYAKLYIKGGELQQDNFIAIKNDSKGLVEMTGGKVISKHESTFQNWANANVTGGRIDGLVWALAYDEAGDSVTNLSDKVVVNGKIWAENYKPETGKKKADVNVKGGTYNLFDSVGKPGEPIRVKGKTSKVEISAGKFNIDPTPYLAPGVKAPVKRYDGSYGVGPDAIPPKPGQEPVEIANTTMVGIAVRPRYPLNNTGKRLIQPADMMIEEIYTSTFKKVIQMSYTAAVAIVVDGKKYPLDMRKVDEMEEQFKLCQKGEPLTIKEDPKFGIFKLCSFVGYSSTENAEKFDSNTEYSCNVISGECRKVLDFEALGIPEITHNGYWMLFDFDLEAATAEGYKDLVMVSTGKPIVQGDNFFDVTDLSKPNGIIGKLVIDEEEVEVSMYFDNRASMDANKLDYDPYRDYRFYSDKVLDKNARAHRKDPDVIDMNPLECDKYPYSKNVIVTNKYPVEPEDNRIDMNPSVDTKFPHTGNR